MKKVFSLILALAMVFAFISCKNADTGEEEDEAQKQAPYKIGIITGSAAQGEEYYGAENVKEKYGDIIVTATYPDDYSIEIKKVTDTVSKMAEDPDVKVIIFVQAVPGASAAIEQVRETRDDIIFICGATNEDPSTIASQADVVLHVDEEGVGTAMVDQAAAMGAKTFVHISFQRHLGYDDVTAQREQIIKRCEELNIEFVEAEAPDPTGSEGIEGAKQWIDENIPDYVEQYGKDTAFFCTSCSMQSALIRRCAELGAIFPQQCCPSPYHGYPEAFSISLDDHEGDTEYLMGQIEEKAEGYGMTGRMSTWSVSPNMMMIEAAVKYAIGWCDGNFQADEGRTYNETALLEEIKNIGGEGTTVEKYEEEESGTLDNYYVILCPYRNF